MSRTERSNVSLVAAALLVLVGGPFSIGCTTRPLVLRPTVIPIDFVPEEQYPRLSLVSFVDESPEETRHFGENRKVYREPPVSTFNDTLLNSFRMSQAFESVARDSGEPDRGYVLEGTVVSIGTHYDPFDVSNWVSGEAIEGHCTTQIRLRDVTTGEIVLEETIETSGRGAVQYSGGGMSSHQNPATGVTTFSSDGRSSDPVPGYETSMSEAIAKNVAEITRRVVEALENGREPPAVSTGSSE